MITEKQRKVFKSYIEDKGKPFGEHMVNAGYSKATAHNPQYLVKSRGWKELLAKELPDSKLLDKHNQFLNSKNPHIGIRALDMAYQLKGNYAPAKQELAVLDITSVLDQIERKGNDTKLEAKGKDEVGNP